MARSDFRTPRLFLDRPIEEGARMPLGRDQANYLLNVLRLETGATVLVFDGENGEHKAKLEAAGRKLADLVIGARTRPQPPTPDLLWLFAPLKHARLDYMIQKAVEMGVGRVRPVITRHTQVSRINLDRMVANAIEAAEQCGVLSVPIVEEEVRLDRLLDRFAEDEPGRRLIFCDEGEETTNPLPALSRLGPGPVAVLIGPEGGFAEEERARLRGLPFVTAVPLGPRILRADTAAVAALAVVQATLGDW